MSLLGVLRACAEQHMTLQQGCTTVSGRWKVLSTVSCIPVCARETPGDFPVPLKDTVLNASGKTKLRAFLWNREGYQHIWPCPGVTSTPSVLDPPLLLEL